jgi:hypothetical protein
MCVERERVLQDLVNVVLTQKATLRSCSMRICSNPAGRAKFQRLGSENQVLLIAVGPLWNELSTGPGRHVAIRALGAQNQILLVAVGLVPSRIPVEIHAPCRPADAFALPEGFMDVPGRPVSSPVSEERRARAPPEGLLLQSL